MKKLKGTFDHEIFLNCHTYHIDNEYTSVISSISCYHECSHIRSTNCPARVIMSDDSTITVKKSYSCGEKLVPIGAVLDLKEVIRLLTEDACNETATFSMVKVALDLS